MSRDVSEHHWFQDERKHDLIVILDDRSAHIGQAATALPANRFSRLWIVTEATERLEPKSRKLRTKCPKLMITSTHRRNGIPFLRNDRSGDEQ